MSTQVVRVLGVKDHPTYPAHVNVTVGAETFCYFNHPGFSGDRTFRLKLGEEATATVARDVFQSWKVKPGEKLDGERFGYYAARTVH